MPKDLQTIVQRMIDANEPEENIASVIQEMKSVPLNEELDSIEANKYEPDTFSQGVINSLSSGEALGTGLKGGLGFAQGAIADLPASIWGGLKTIGGMVTDPSETAGNIFEGLSNLPGEVIERFSKAGSEPQEFGRMMGQMTGQPLATAGISRIPLTSVIRGMGTPVKALGKIGRQYGYASSVLPPFTIPRIIRLGERMLGRGIESVGRKMKSVGRTDTPNLSTGVPSKPSPEVKSGTNLTYKIVPDKLTQTMKEKLKESGYVSKDIERGMIVYKKTGNSKSNIPVKSNIPNESNSKGIAPNMRAKIYRGAHDPVDVFFPDANSRDLFGAGQSMAGKTSHKQSQILQRFGGATKRVVTQYGISEEVARKALQDYNQHIRDVSKLQPKQAVSGVIGDLNFKAPSFEKFLGIKK